MNCQLTGTARLGADPELRFTPGGKAICELRLAFSNSKKDRDTGKYVYTPAIWVSVTLWEKMAENAAEVLRKGDEVVASGQLELEQYEKRDGGTGEKLVLRAAEVAPSIRRGAVATREASDSRPPARSNGRPQTAAQPVPPAADPWAGTQNW